MAAEEEDIAKNCLRKNLYLTKESLYSIIELLVIGIRYRHSV